MSPSALSGRFKDFVNTQAKKAQLPAFLQKGVAKQAEEEKKGEEGETKPEERLAVGDKKPKVWHPQQEKLLKQWAEISTSFRWMHHQAHLRFARMHFWFTLPVIVMSSITGTMNFAQGTFPADYEVYVPLFIGAINLIAGIITTVASYLRVSELSEGNRVASMMFGKLSRNIRVELLLPTSERTMDGCDFISMCRSELDRLTEQTPDIPVHIENRFLRKFQQLLRTTDFYPPEIADLHPVQIYHDVEEIKTRRTANVVADAAVAFKIAGERRASRPSSPVPSPPLNPVQAVVAPAVPKMDLMASRNTLNKELSQLSSLQTVSARLSSRLVNKGNQAREKLGTAVANGVATFASAAAAVTDEVALTNALFEDGTKGIELTTTPQPKQTSSEQASSDQTTEATEATGANLV